MRRIRSAATCQRATIAATRSNGRNSCKAKLVSERRAAHVLYVQFSDNDPVSKVSRTGVQTYVGDMKWSAKAPPMRTMLPEVFDCALIKWINAPSGSSLPGL